MNISNKYKFHVIIETVFYKESLSLIKLIFTISGSIRHTPFPFATDLFFFFQLVLHTIKKIVIFTMILVRSDDPI